MVRINDLLVLGTVIIAGSILKKGYSDPQTSFIQKGIINQQSQAKQTTKTTLGFLSKIDDIYNVKDNINFQAIQDITTAQDKLQQIRSQTLAQEKKKTEFQIDYLQSQKQKSNVIISQLKKIIDVGMGYETYSPRVRSIIMRKKGYDPIDYGAIERGKQAQSSTQKITSFIQNLENRITGIKSDYKKLESI
jgi:hypothetical protein